MNDQTVRPARRPLHEVLEKLIGRPGGRATEPDNAFAFLRPGSRKQPRKAGAGRDAALPEQAARPAAAGQKAPPTSPEAVRRELAIRPDYREADLRALRKRFAAGNHPDRCPLALREVAEQRMKLANSIIDGEIARRRLAR